VLAQQQGRPAEAVGHLKRAIELKLPRTGEDGIASILLAKAMAEHDAGSPTRRAPTSHARARSPAHRRRGGDVHRAGRHAGRPDGGRDGRQRPGVRPRARRGGDGARPPARDGALPVGAPGPRVLRSRAARAQPRCSRSRRARRRPGEPGGARGTA
jgi:hypothetical protein